MPSVGPDGWLWIVSVLASGGAAVSLWFGAARVPDRDRAGYRWLLAAAAVWCVGSATQQVLSGQVSDFTAPLTLADLLPLIALVPAVMGIIVLADPRPPATGTPAEDAASEHSGTAARAARAARWPFGLARWSGLTTQQVTGGLLDGYVTASALLIIGWLTVLGGVYRRSGADPETFLLGMLRPLAGVVVLSLLLPRVTTATRQVIVPYLALIAVTVGDTFGGAVRFAGGHQPRPAELIARTVGYLLLLSAPWFIARAAGHDRDPGKGRRSSAPQHSGGAAEQGQGPAQRPVAAKRAVAGLRPPAAAIISSLAAAAAALLIVVSVLAGSSRVQAVVILAGSGAVLALVLRVLGLLRENGLAVAAARVSGRHVRELADRTSDAVLICDLDGAIRYASPSAAGYGYATGRLLGRNLAEFVHPEDRSTGIREIRRIVGADAGAASRVEPAGNGAEPSGASGRAGYGGTLVLTEAPVVSFRCRVLAADGTWRHVECTVSGYQQPGESDQLLVTARDLSDEIALRQQLTDLIFHDQLTGLPNRAYFEERVVDVLNRRRGSSAAQTGDGRADTADDLAAELAALHVAAVFLHMDGLFAVKDSAGHAAADLLLTQAASRLREAVPPRHTLARWGGDEFAVLVEARDGAQETVDLAEQLARCIAAQPFGVAGRDVALTASVGVAFAGDSPAGDVMRNADVAMSRARTSGGGRVEIFAAHMHADVVRRLELTSDLQRAIAEESLSLEFQPIVELATARVIGAEALVRWHRGGEQVLPGDFLGLAEESGLIVALGDWVLRESCRHVARWRQRAAWDVGVSVNVSPRQMAAPGFVQSVLAALASNELPASALSIEVAEQVLVGHHGETARRLAELRRAGVLIAVDDFGTGYASLGSLRQLPVDIIKIDPSFVSGVGTDDTLTLLTGAIVRLGHDLGVTVVAEGIERPGQLEMLRELGCARGQGYLVARPVPAPDVGSLIAQNAGRCGPDVPEQGKAPAPAP